MLEAANWSVTWSAVGAWKGIVTNRTKYILHVGRGVQSKVTYPCKPGIIGLRYIITVPLADILRKAWKSAESD